MSEEMGDNVQGALNRLSSTIEGVVLRFYESKGILRDLIDLVTLMVEGVGGMIDMFNKWGVVTYTVTAYLVSYYGGLKITTMWHARFKTATLASVVAEKAHAVQLYISRAATLTYAAAQALLHKNTTRCTAALRLMRIELLKNPYAAVTALILSAGMAIYQFTKKLKEARDAQANFNKIESEVSATLQQEKDQIKSLTKAIHDTNLSVDERREYIKKLQEIVPEYHASIKDEGGLYDENTEAIKRYLKARENEMKMNSLKSLMQPLYDEKLSWSSKGTSWRKKSPI